MQPVRTLGTSIIAILLLVITFAIIPSAAQSAPAGTPMGYEDRGFTVFYADKGYKGFAAHAYEGQEYPNLGSLANQASSFISYSDWETCVWTNAGFAGNPICFDPGASVSDLSAYGLNDNIKSIKLRRVTKLDMLDYFHPNRNKPFYEHTRNRMSDGQYFYSMSRQITRARVRAGDQGFIIVKNEAGNVYEEFTYDNQFIYHLRDTSWATGPNQNVKCNGTDDDAMFTLREGSNEGAPWVPRYMQIGQSATLERDIISINKRTCQVCNTAHDGDMETQTHTIKLVRRGPMSWPVDDGNTFSHNDVIYLVITEGVGKGDHFWYARGLGWVGFEHGNTPGGQPVTIHPSGHQPANHIRQYLHSTQPFNEVCSDTIVPLPSP